MIRHLLKLGAQVPEAVESRTGAGEEHRRTDDADEATATLMRHHGLEGSDPSSWLDLVAVTAGQADWAPAGYELAHCQVAVAAPVSAGVPALAAHGTCNGVPTTTEGLVGTPNDDVIVGTAGNDLLVGRGISEGSHGFSRTPMGLAHGWASSGNFAEDSPRALPARRR